jgi:hypothetical protein
MPTEAMTLAIDRVPTQSLRICTGCGPRPRGAFSPRPRSPDGLRSRCKRCERLAQHVHYHDGGGKAKCAEYKAREDVKLRDRERARREDVKRRAKEQRRKRAATPRGKFVKARSNARERLKKATTDGRRAELEAVIKACDRELARLDAGHELPVEPVPPAGDCDFLGVHRTKHGTFSVLITVPGQGQVRGGSHATIEAARAEANRLGREHGIDEYAVPKWRRRA